MSLLCLPGELMAHIRDSIPMDDISAHFALFEAMVDTRIIYDEQFWRRLCFANGIGGVWSPGSRPSQWRSTARLIMNCREGRVCGSRLCAESLEWASSGPKVITPQEVRDQSIKLSTNPIFDNLRLNWRSSDPLSSAFIRSNNSEAGPTSMLAGHLAAFAFATSCPVSQLEINLESHIASHYGFAPLLVEREDGVRVRDVIATIQSWMELPLPTDVREMLMEETRARDPETFRLLEETTDEWTMAAFWDRKFRLRRDMVWMHFSGLSMIDQDSISGRPTVKVAFDIHDSSFTHVGDAELSRFCHKSQAEIQ